MLIEPKNIKVKYLVMRSLHNKIIVMKNNLQIKISFITHVLATTIYLLSNDRNVSKLVTVSAKNSCFVFKDFIPYFTAR